MDIHPAENFFLSVSNSGETKVVRIGTGHPTSLADGPG